MDLSVIIAAYNAERYLKECLLSVKACPATQVECIIVNDGSTDGTRALCEAFTAADPRFTLLNKENTGVSDSRNRGIAHARGNYVLILDADDTLDTTCWPTILQHAGENRYDMVAYAHTSLFPSGKKQVEHFPFEGETSTRPEDLWRSLLATPMLNVCWGKLLRTGVIRRHGLLFEKGRRTGEDTLFMLDFAQNTDSFLLAALPVLFYRIHPASAMRQMDMAGKLSDFEAIYRRRLAFWQSHQDAQIYPEMYRQFFSVITNLFRECAAQNPAARPALHAALQNGMVQEILANTNPRGLSPVYKKLEYRLMRGGHTALLARYFAVKNRFDTA